VVSFTRNDFNTLQVLCVQCKATEKQMKETSVSTISPSEGWSHAFTRGGSDLTAVSDRVNVLASARSILDKLNGIAWAYESIVNGLCSTLEDSKTDEAAASMSRKHEESTKHLYSLIKNLNDQLLQKEFETKLLRQTAQKLEASVLQRTLSTSIEVSSASSPDVTTNSCSTITQDLAIRTPKEESLTGDLRQPPIRELTFSKTVVDVSHFPRKGSSISLKNDQSVRLLL